MVSFNTVSLTKNQKNAFKNEAKNLSCSNTKIESMTDVQEPKDNTVKSARTEVLADSGIKKGQCRKVCTPQKDETRC